MLVVKLGPDYYGLVKYSESVGFSQKKGWFLLDCDLHKPEKKKQRMKWVPSTTTFDWCREFPFEPLLLE